MLAVVVAVVGTVLYMFPGGGEVTFGYVSNDGGALPAILFLTFRRVFGVILLWFGTLLIAGLVGHRLATRRQND